ncbi:MAG TPA: fused MFS/spermidine synthase [Bryobacteraceae bacterium]|nr:fused MFS/spermidine synthase [Bryobacteraceae bacterium]
MTTKGRRNRLPPAGPPAAVRTDPEPLAARIATTGNSPEFSRLLPWVLFLFAGSGFAALVYEIIWFQLLQLAIGSSAVSLGLLLAAYMGGLCAGSAMFPRLVSARQNPLRVYALLELGIGIFGVVALVAVPLAGRLYASIAATGLIGMILRGLVAALCLLPPTLLMGASLPAISRWAEATPRGVSRLGFLYSANIAGAVIGCVAAGFYLLRVYDMAVATWAAAAVNCAVAVLAWVLSRHDSTGGERAADPPSERAPARRAPGAMLIYLAIAFSGLTALGAEVVWTRLLSLLLGPTVYTFSIILAVYLVGLCGGSSAGSFLSRRVRNPGATLALCQILIAAGIAWTAWTLVWVLPYWPADPWLSINPWANFDFDVMRCLRSILPATLLWGASFPLALAAAAAEGEDPGRLSGEVYAANTAGSIVGALAFSLLLIPSIGTQNSERLLVWLAAVGALAAIAPFVITVREKTTRNSGVGRFASYAAGAAAAAWLLSSTVSGIPWQAMAYGRRIAPILRDQSLAGDNPTTPAFVAEGINASVVIAQRGDERFFYVSGKAEASSGLLDMRLQRMMGHIPALVHPAPKSVLVVGFGAGVTAGSFVPYPEVSSIVICELEPSIPPASDEFFGKENNHVLRDRRTRVVYDDARHYILTAPGKFDVITTDPIHPWVKGTSTLYSKEYYELVRRHLNPGGVVAQWLPIYESDEETIKTELATFFSVFPTATVWSNYLNGDGYDLVLLGAPDTPPIDVNALQQRLSEAGYAQVSASLAETGFHSAVDLLSTYAGRAIDLAPMLAGAQINDDLNMRLQYLAGLGLNSVISPRVYAEILSYRQFPDGLLVGQGENFDALRELIRRPHKTF